MNENNINLASAHILDAINFTDPLVQQICLEHWDFDHDGIFSYYDASLVCYLEDVFQGTPITSFPELKYFTSLGKDTPDEEPTARMIDDRQFMNCRHLKEITLPQQIASIGEYCFFGCESLQQVTLSDDRLDYCPHNAFLDCIALKNVMNPSKTKLYFVNASELCDGHYTVPEGITAIGTECFARMKDLHSITLPASLRFIGMSACMETSLEQVIIPPNCYAIDCWAFENCVSLKKVHLPSSCAIQDEVFIGCHKLLTVRYEPNKEYL